MGAVGRAIAAANDRGGWRPGVRGGLLALLSSAALWPYGALAGLLAAVMWPAWFTVDQLIIRGDMLLGYYPWHVLWREVVAGRESLFWNPYTFGGTPSFAAAHSGFAYPGHWLLTPLPPIQAVNWTIGLHVVLAGLGAAWCARGLGASRDGMFLSGVAYALGSALTARLEAGHIGFIEANAWLPFAVGATVRIDRPGQVCVLAIAVAMMVLTGQPEPWLFSLWLLPLCAVALTAGRDPLRHVRALLRTGAGLALGIGLAAFFVLPFLAYLEVSNRSAGMSWAFQTATSLPLWHIATALAPGVFGYPLSGYWAGPGYEWHERLIYVGVIPLIAALWAPDRRRLFWLLVAGAALAVALGRYGPAFSWAQVLPGYASMRIPPKHLIVVALALALAAGLGFERLRGWWVSLVVAVLAGGVAWLALQIDLMTGRLITWTGEATRFEVDQLGDALTVAQPSMFVAAGLLGIAALTVALPGRWGRLTVLTVAALDVWLVLAAHRTTLADPSSRIAGLDGLRQLERVAYVGAGAEVIGNYGPVLGVVFPSGYQSVFSGAYMELLTGNLNPGVTVAPSRSDDPVLRLLGYQYLFVAERRTVLVMKPDRPDVWVARCAWPGRARDVRAPDFPIFSCVTHPSATEREAPVEPGPAVVTDRAPATLHVTVEGPGWLVTTMPWYPGWRATVDGVPRPVDVVDGALVSVRLEPGSHQVTLWYVPAGLEPGLALSALAVLLTAGAWLADRYWRRLPPRLSALWRPTHAA